MDAEEETTPAETHGLPDEIDERRLQVQRLRHRRMSETQIARAIGVHHSTVSRDLAWLRTHAADRLDPQAFNSKAFVAASLAFYEDVESQAMFEAVKAGSTFDKVLCLKLATTARQKQLDLLLDTGHIVRTPLQLAMNLPTADQIRAALQAATLELDDPNIIDVGD